MPEKITFAYVDISSLEWDIAKNRLWFTVVRPGFTTAGGKEVKESRLRTSMRGDTLSAAGFTLPDPVIESEEGMEQFDEDEDE